MASGLRGRLEIDGQQFKASSVAPSEAVRPSADAAKVDVREQGLTVLCEGSEPVADIVFIHGIQGHPRETWTYGADSPKLKSKVSRLFSGKKKAGGKQSSDGAPDTLYWPEDLLSKSFKDLRILTYGYDSHVSHFFKGPSNQNNINAHGRSLLHSLELYRRQDPKRKLIFVVHSLGGLILKETLRRSKRSSEEDQDLRNIYQSLYAITFFGTPHRGSSYTEIGITAQKIIKAIGFDGNDALLRNLRADGEHLEMLREEFASMLDERTFKVYSFQEGQGYKGTHALSRKIVDDASSSLDHPVERKDFINANHVMMCKFRNSNDDGYIKVHGVISKYVEEIREQSHRKQQKLIQKHKNLLNGATYDDTSSDVNIPTGVQDEGLTCDSMDNNFSDKAIGEDNQVMIHETSLPHFRKSNMKNSAHSESPESPNLNAVLLWHGLRTMLLQEAKNGNESTVRQLLQKGVDPNFTGPEGWTPLFWAANRGYGPTARLLLEKGANPDFQSQEGLTPLWTAVYNHHDGVVRLLLQNRFDQGLSIPDNQVALFWAAYNGEAKKVRSLLGEGLDPNFKDPWGVTPLFWAANNHHEVVVELLLGKEVDVDPKNPDGRTPLFQAACHGNKSVAKLLFKNGANGESRDRWGETPLF